MEDFEFECPKCKELLLADEETAGSEAVCPYCDSVITMPAGPEPKKLPPVVAAAPEGGRKKKGKGRRRSKNQKAAKEQPAEQAAATIPASNGEAAVATFDPGSENGGAGDDYDPEAERQRLASAAGAGAGTFSNDKFTRKGKFSFSCPGCAGPIWIKNGDGGKVVACGTCSAEVVCPTPNNGQAARLVNPPEQRERSVLPTERANHHMPTEEPAPANLGLQDSGRKGLESFACVQCRRPVWIKTKDLGKAIECGECGQMNISPDPKTNSPARLITPTQNGPRDKTVLPQKRSIDTRPPDEFVVDDDERGAKTRLPKKIQPLGAPIGQEGGGHRLRPDLQPNFIPKEGFEDDTQSWGTEQSGKSGRPLLWLALLLIPALAGAAAFTYYKVRNQQPTDAVAAADVEPTADPFRHADEAIALIQGMFAAKSWEEMTSVVRHPDITRPKMENFTAVKLPLDGKLDEDADYGEFERGGKQFVTTTIMNWDLTPERRGVAFEITDSGLKLDWESFVFYSEIPWSDFVAKGITDSHAFMVTIEAIDYYDNREGKFNENEWASFRVEDAGEYASCYGYAKADSEVVQKIAIKMREERAFRSEMGLPLRREGDAEAYVLPTLPPIKVVAKIRFAEGGKALNQVIIEDIVSDSWVQP